MCVGQTAGIHRASLRVWIFTLYMKETLPEERSREMIIKPRPSRRTRRQPTAEQGMH